MKKRLSRILALVLALAMCLSLVSCAAKPAEEAKESEEAKEPTAENADVSSEKAEDESEEVETIKIGYLGTLSGGNATTGNASLWGAQMIVDIINNESDVALMLAEDAGLPNLNGAKIELVVGDNKGETETMTSECRRMIEEGCVAICGQFTSGPLREFCVSDFRQNQEYHVFNVHDDGLFPLSTSVPEGWGGMRAACGVNAGSAFRESCFKGIILPCGPRT